MYVIPNCMYKYVVQISLCVQMFSKISTLVGNVGAQWAIVLAQKKMVVVSPHHIFFRTSAGVVVPVHCFILCKIKLD